MSYSFVRKDGEKNEKVKITRHFPGKPIKQESDESEEETVQKVEIKNKIQIKYEKKKESSDEEDEQTKRRAEIRRRMLEREKEENSVETKQETPKIEIVTRQTEKIQLKEEIKQEQESSDEDEDEEEEERPLLKPLFVPKTHRNTIFELKQKQEEELRMQEEQEKKRQERVLETTELIKSKPKEDVNIEIDDLPDDSDDEDDETEYELWKQREIKRVKRENNEKYEKEKERLEIERRRNMTDFERKQEDEELEKLYGKKEKKHWKYLQRYYHQGVFFQDEKEKDTDFGKVLKRDYASAPTGDDTTNKEILPKMMQVRNYGKKGRTKYTHLSAEDTTFIDKDNPYLQDDLKRKIARSIVVQQQQELKKRKL